MADVQIIEIAEQGYLVVDDLTSTQIIETAEVELLEFDDDTITVVEFETDTDSITIEEEVVELLTEAVQGPTGPPGPTGTGYESTFVAGIDLSGHRAVVFNDVGKLVYADASSPSQGHAVVGITTNAALTDDNVTVKTYGDFEELSWNWTINLPIYLGNNGVLTQTQQPGAFVLVMGVAISQTKMFVNIRQPIFLA